MSRWLAVLALAVSPATAHDWYGHRTVPGTHGFLHCCGGRDCKRVSEQEFDIWIKNKNPLHHPIEDSEDDGWHICSQPAGDDRTLHRALIVRCAFKPREISGD